MFNDSDEYDFNPANSTKLASLFDNTISSNVNTSLTYTAPKQPKTGKEYDVQETVRNKPATSVLMAKIVSLWKLEDKDYKTLGKHGLAVIGSVELNLYEMIAYKEKNNILLRKKINEAFQFYNKKDFFSTLSDNDNQNWLVKFETSEDQHSFCQTLKNYRAKIIDDIEEIQQSNDKIQTISKEVKSEVSANTEAFEKDIEIHSDSSGSQKRATILSRMAKMGQQILPSPLVKNTSTDISDSELEDTKGECKIPPRKMKRSVHTEKNVTLKEEKPTQSTYFENQLVPAQNCNYNSQNFSYPIHPQNIVPPVYYGQPMQCDGFTNFILSQNTELKMNLSQISAKLDNVLSFNNTNLPKSEDSNLKSKIKTLEIRSENLQNELETYQKRYNEQQILYKELKDKIHQDTVESTERETLIQNLREEIIVLNAKVEENEKIATTDKKILQQEVEEYRAVADEGKKTVEIQKSKIDELQKLYKEYKDKNIESTVESLNETVTNLNTKLKELEEYYQKTEEEKLKQTELNNKKIDLFSDKIKQHMNNMYQTILGNFSEDSSYSLSEINSSIAHGLKSTTFKIIDDIKNIYKNENIE